MSGRDIRKGMARRQAGIPILFVCQGSTSPSFNFAWLQLCQASTLSRVNVAAPLQTGSPDAKSLYEKSINKNASGRTGNVGTSHGKRRPDRSGSDGLLFFRSAVEVFEGRENLEDCIRRAGIIDRLGIAARLDELLCAQLRQVL